MKKIKINVPEGYEIDKDKSTFEEIVFKKKDELPKTWKELNGIKGHMVSGTSKILPIFCKNMVDNCKNVFPSEETARAGGILLPMLLQLRDRYRNGWKPDWVSDSIIYVIIAYEDGLSIQYSSNTRGIFAFQSEEIAQQFLDNFRDMLEEYFNTLTE